MRNKMTIHELLSCKGKRMVSIATAFDYETAKACDEAELDIILTWSKTMGTMDEVKLRLREVCSGAPGCMTGVAMPILPAYTSETEAVRCAYDCICSGGNLIYASGMDINKYRAIQRERLPTVGHVGLVPFQSTWIGGLRAVGKNSAEAMEVYRKTLEYQDAGCVAVEMECVPEKVAAYIASKVDLMVFSMGSGSGCDGQFLFTCDVLGTNDGHIPRHAVVYRSLYREMVEGLSAYRAEVDSGAFPPRNKVINISDNEFEGFLSEAEKIKQ